MELMLIVGGVIFFGIIVFLLIEHPYIIATFVLFSYLYQFNIETSLPLDFRGILLILLFARLVVFDRENIGLIMEHLFPEKFFYLITAFLFLSLFVALFYSLKPIPQIRSFVLLSIGTILGFIVTANNKGKNVFIYSIIISGLISAIDVFYSFLYSNMSSSLNMVRVIDVLVFKNKIYYNQASLGMMCAMGFIYAYLFYIRKEFNRIISLLLMFILGMGVLLSTSRSTILSIIIVFIIVAVLQREITFNFKTIINVFLVCFVFFVSFYFFYNTILKSSDIEKSTLDQVYWRLYGEPLKLFGENVKEFDEYSGKEKEGTMTWRYFRSLDDLNRYSNLSIDKKMFGIGIGGYEKTNFAHDYMGSVLNAHNGYVLLLVERGLLGLFLFLIFSIGLSIKGMKYTKRYYIHTPLVYLFIMLMIFAIGQNSELTGVPAFLMLGGIIGNITNFEEIEEESDLPDELPSKNKVLQESFTNL